MTLKLRCLGRVRQSLTAGIRGDVAWVTSKLGMFMQQADESHMKIADRVIMYLAPTTTVFEDNEAAQALANNDTMTKKSRYRPSYSSYYVYTFIFTVYNVYLGHIINALCTDIRVDARGNLAIL